MTNPTKVVIEIPDLPDPQGVDSKYVAPLQALLVEEGVGEVIAVETGQVQTPEEFSRFLIIQLVDYECGLDLIGEHLERQDAPVGTMITAYHDNGEIRDTFIRGPDDLE
jgi:hypothetical protein